jgi:hypothetical protein
MSVRPRTARRHEWAVDDESRYGIYLGHPRDTTPYTTSKEGIGTTLVQLREDGELTDQHRVGILDGFVGRWVTNPFARG